MSSPFAPRRLNRYTCACGNSILAEDKDEGVTPFFMACGACGGRAQSSFYQVAPEDQQQPADIEWYAPSPAEVKKLTRPMRTHVEDGGLCYRVASDRPAVHHLRVLQERQWKESRA